MRRRASLLEKIAIAERNWMAGNGARETGRSVRMDLPRIPRQYSA
jgi:hypothetical protein